MKRRGVIKFVILVALIAAAIATVRLWGASGYLSEERLRLWISGFGVWGPLVYIAVYSIAPALMVPGLPLTVIGGVLFGPVRGSVYVITGATIGAALAFLVARYLGRDWVAAMIKGTRLERLDAEAARRGWRIVAITRLIPLFPFNLLNYAFGLTSIGFIPYLIASFVFMAPGAIAYVLLGSSIPGLLQGRFSTSLAIGVFFVVIIALGPVIYGRVRNKGD
ncbi:MAG: TVP38/TMEM64 family protein [Deltaproteobacteria bacterium]|nr:TVP38/TMEM64 family protein [Deltaproteobacteria bacterium]